MKKILFSVFLLLGILIAGSASANIISNEYYPEVYFWVDGQPIDDNYTIREKHQYFTKAGKERFEDWFEQCAEGKCRLMAHIKNPDRYWYFLAKEGWEDEIEITEEVRSMNLEPRTLRKIDYEVRIDTEQGIIDLKEVDKGEYDPLAELEENNRNVIPTEQIIAIMVGVGVLLVAIVLAIVFTRKKKG